MSAVAVSTLSQAEARSLTDEVKLDAERLWRKLVELYDGGAHLALNYDSWGAYFKTEFGGSQTRAYALLDAGRVVKALESFPHAGMVPNARQATELARLKDDPDALREAWAEVVERHPEPTAADVREVVSERMPMSNKATMNANAELRRVHSALAAISGASSALDDVRIDRVLSVATDDDLAAFESLAAGAISALHRLRRNLKEER